MKCRLKYQRNLGLENQTTDLGLQLQNINCGILTAVFGGINFGNIWRQFQMSLLVNVLDKMEMKLNICCELTGDFKDFEVKRNSWRLKLASNLSLCYRLYVIP